MIKKIFFFLLSGASLLASNSLNNVTVSEYAKFLNVMAQEDPRTLYDQKMGEESGIASIERVGNAGNYSYHFREEEAEESVMFIDLRSDVLPMLGKFKNGLLRSGRPVTGRGKNLNQLDSPQQTFLMKFPQEVVLVCKLQALLTEYVHQFLVLRFQEFFVEFGQKKV